MRESLFCFLGVGWATNKNEPAVTIATFDIAALVDLQINFWMAKGRGNIAAAVAGNTGVTYADRFRCSAHIAGTSKAEPRLQRAVLGHLDIVAHRSCFGFYPLDPVFDEIPYRDKAD